MAIDPKSEDGVAVRKLTPFNTIPSSYFQTLCEEMTVVHATQGTMLFKLGEETTDRFYLVSGSVGLQSDEFVVEIISAGEGSSQFPLAHQIPRKINAIAKNDIRYLRIAADLIKQPPVDNSEGESSFMITDEIDENDGDWMTQLLTSPIFRHLPAANLQNILMGFQDISVKGGELIVGQDQPADYYFIIKSGTCVLTRKPAPNAKEITLAKLGANDSFGEEAIISGNLRNVSVTAVTNMTLLRMDKDRFNSLIKEEVLRFISYQEMQQKESESILILDVRSPDAYTHQHIENSINIPLFSLRMQLKSLNRKKNIIVVCQDGSESSVAAFLLIKNKFNVAVLEGGINSVPDDSTNQAAVFELDDGQEILSVQEPIVSEESFDQSEFILGEVEVDDGFIDDIDGLRKKNKELKDNYANLLQEKEQVEKDYRILQRQTEKLKAVLKKLQVEG
jgi:CRP-like cAMP-binding protein